MQPTAALHWLAVVLYYCAITSKRDRGPFTTALRRLAAMVHATSRPLRDAATRALIGMRLRKKCTVVQMEYDLDSACGTCNGTSTCDSEAMPFPEECAFAPVLHQAMQPYGEALPVSHRCLRAPPTTLSCVCQLLEAGRHVIIPYPLSFLLARWTGIGCEKHMPWEFAALTPISYRHEGYHRQNPR